jgi:hypothetical protein
MNNTKTLKIMRAISLAVLALPMAAFASMRIHLLKKQGRC